MILDRFSLDGRVALVTGAGRGLGQGIALALAEAGADVALLVRDDAAETVRQVTALGPPRGGHRVRPARRRRAGAERRRRHRRRPVRPARHPGEQRGDDPSLAGDRAQRSRLGRRPAGQPAKRLLPLAGGGRACHERVRWRQDRQHRVDALLPGRHQRPVATPPPRADVGGLTRALANEWAPLGINVNAIAPGYIATDNTAPLRADEDRSAAILGRIPAGRWGTADDLHGAVVFLASDASAYVHGAILPVDGGWLPARWATRR